MEDDQIIDLYWARSERAIAETENKYGRYCHTIAYNILRNDQDAEECLNDTYIKAWNVMPPQRPNHLAAFLGRITRNLSLDRYRMNRAGKRAPGQLPLVLSELEDCIPAEESVEKIINDMVLTESLERFLYALPRLKRNIFIRRYWYLSSIKEIAQAYGMSESKTTSMLHRLRLQLKTHLREDNIL
ncbi:MAG: RNA polymerase sigma factor [Christensenellales bacterium]|jgi:RNA polymerase sigma factor (sigma-70 family)